MVGLVVGLVILSIGFGLIETFWPAVPKKRWRRGMWTDIAYWFVTPLVSKTLALVAVAIVAVVAAAVAGMPIDGEHVKAFVHRSTWFTGLPLALQVVILMLLIDLLAYWMHRAFHRGRLWRFPAPPPSSKDPAPASSPRRRSADSIVTRAWQTPALFSVRVS